MRAVRDLLRRRLLLVKQRTAQLLSLQSAISRYTGCRLASLRVKQLTPETIRSYFPDPSAQFSALQSHQLLHQFDKQIDAIETFVLSQCDATAYGVITSTPGIGKILGMTILLETGPIKRFDKVGHYSSYARCVPSTKVSNGKIKGRGNTKNGNRYLAMAFVEAAHYACIWDATIKKYYQRKCKKVPIMVAKKTIANKLTRACYHMLKTNSPFELKLSFG